jgi:2-methylcitrate dehydratase PrpD
MTIAAELARRIVAMRYEALPAEAVHWARVGVLDTIGVTLAGANEDAARITAATLPLAPGPALVLGSRRRVAALDAALVNGTASHALDFDDCNNTLGGHPSVPIVPALVALAEETGASGRDLVLAYVAGFETETRIARGVNFHHYEKGWHPTATLGIFGAAAACARLMNLDAGRTATALAIAASLASGIKANFGTMVKPLHIGQCSRNGLFAALLAKNGYTAGERAFEHPQGFLEVFNGAGTYDAARILADWAAPLDITDPGIAIKQYPCCGSTHPALDAMLAIRRQHAPRPDEIERIEAWIHKRRLAHTNRPAPAGNLDAKFSLQYCLARALVEGRVVLEHFEGDAWRDSAVQALLPRIRVAPYDDTQFDPANHFAGEVRVTLSDGRVLAAKVEQPLGRTVRNPLPEDLLHDKFLSCAARVLDAAQARSALAALGRLESLSSIRELTALLEPRPAMRPAASAPGAH